MSHTKLTNILISASVAVVAIITVSAGAYFATHNNAGEQVGMCHAPNPTLASND